MLSVGKMYIPVCYAIVFEHGGVEKVRFAEDYNPDDFNESKAKDFLSERFGFTDCRIIQIAAMVSH